MGLTLSCEINSSLSLSTACAQVFSPQPPILHISATGSHISQNFSVPYFQILYSLVMAITSDWALSRPSSFCSPSISSA